MLKKYKIEDEPFLEKNLTRYLVFTVTNIKFNSNAMVKEFVGNSLEQYEDLLSIFNVGEQ